MGTSAFGEETATDGTTVVENMARIGQCSRCVDTHCFLDGSLVIFGAYSQQKCVENIIILYPQPRTDWDASKT